MTSQDVSKAIKNMVYTILFGYVCECVSRRAGRAGFMVSAGITALLKKMDYKDVVGAVDGSVFR